MNSKNLRSSRDLRNQISRSVRTTPKQKSLHEEQIEGVQPSTLPNMKPLATVAKSPSADMSCKSYSNSKSVKRRKNGSDKLKKDIANSKSIVDELLFFKPKADMNKNFL